LLKKRKQEPREAAPLPQSFSCASYLRGKDAMMLCML